MSRMDHDETPILLEDMLQMDRVFDEISQESSQDSAHETGQDGEIEEENDTPNEEVRLTVPPTDNPTQQTITFRVWVIGLLLCVGTAVVNGIFIFRENPINLSPFFGTIVSPALGNLMVRMLTTREFTFPGTNWTFYLNFGSFNQKEHTLITIFANVGSGAVYAVNVITVAKVSYNIKINHLASLFIIISTQMIGYSWVWIFKPFLVDNPRMWWPSNLVQVSLIRAFHKDKTELPCLPKGRITKMQFFKIAFVASFGFHIFPSYFFRLLSHISPVCYFWKESIPAHQIGSGTKGMGFGSFGLHWYTISSALGSPLHYPRFAIVNILVGFFLFIYIIVPIAYRKNIFDAWRFPLMSSSTYDYDGRKYNVSRILKAGTNEFDTEKYKSYSRPYLSITYALDYGLAFATLPAIFMHVICFHGKEICQMWSDSSNVGDVHTRLMKRNYKEVPKSWYAILFVTVVIITLIGVGNFGEQLLPWSGLLASNAISIFFTLPIGAIQATADMPVGLNVFTQIIGGYLYPEQPVTNVVFKTYGYIGMSQALAFLSNYKLGHYMKIPPRDVFKVQVVATLVTSIVYHGITLWCLETIPNICNESIEGNPWPCLSNVVFYNASIIWGLVGPQRIFTEEGYAGLKWFCLIGALAPLPGWLLSMKYPEKEWIKGINTPLIIASGSGIPPAGSVNYTMWGIVGIFFKFIVYDNYKSWWAKFTYILSAALESSVASLFVLLHFGLQSKGINGPRWWGNDASDHCPLATCPIARGVIAEGCS